MKRYLIVILLFSLISCSNYHVIKYYGTVKQFQFISLKDTIQITVKEFYKNNVTCYTEAIPYALIVGSVDNSSDYPKVISILAICDNNNYKIGDKLVISPSADPRINSSLQPLNFTRDTIIHKKKFLYLIGSEYPAVWGDILH